MGRSRSRRRFWIGYTLYAALFVVFPVIQPKWYIWPPGGPGGQAFQQVLFVLIVVGSDPVGRWCYVLEPPSWCWPAILSLYSLNLLAIPLLVALLIRWTVLGLGLQEHPRRRQALLWGYGIYGALLAVLTSLPPLFPSLVYPGGWLEGWENFILACRRFPGFCGHTRVGVLFMLVLNILLYLAMPLVVLGVVGGGLHLRASRMARHGPEAS